MWVSKAEWQRMKERVKELESRASQATSYAHFTIYQKSDITTFYPYSGSLDSQYISVKDVIEKILDKLGMELTYVSGEPKRVEMTKKAKP